MTERRPLPRPPRARLVGTSAVALFLVVLVLLGAQLRAGHDPALAAQAPAPKAGPAATAAADRRIVVTRSPDGATVLSLAPAGSAPQAAAPQAAAPQASSPPPIVTRTS